MDKLQSFENFFMNLESELMYGSSEVPVIWFVINFLYAGLLSYLLGIIYRKFSSSLSNREYFAKNFIIISMTTMLIITIVKSSLALSLGLVGALSIIRFRAAIKEPEELSYIFIAISIGLGFGASQGIITFIAFILLAGIIFLQHTFSKEKSFNNSLHLIVSGKNKSGSDLDNFSKVLKKYCSIVNLKRYDKTSTNFEMVFSIELSSINEFNSIKKEINKIDKNISLSFLDNSETY